MDSNTIIEAVGYAASGLIILSITQKSILRLRLLGLAGSITFLVYALIIAAYPIAVVNLVAAIIHTLYLRRITGRKDEVFRVLHVAPDSSYLLDFLDFYRSDIDAISPHGFSYQPGSSEVTAFVLRDMVPAGLFIGSPRKDGSFEVKLDFVIPQYRDFKIGQYVYSPDSGLFSEEAPTCVWARTLKEEHADYLRRMGFTPAPERAGCYEMRVDSSTGAR